MIFNNNSKAFEFVQYLQKLYYFFARVSASHFMNQIHPINADLVRHHLLEMGYEPDTLPQSVLDQFIKELTELYDSGAFDEDTASLKDDEFMEFESKKELDEELLSSGGNRQKIYKHRYNPNEKAQELTPLEQDSELLKMMEHLNLKKFQETVQNHLETAESDWDSLSRYTDDSSPKSKSRPSTGCTHS
jgi:hypothetical protein